MVKVSIIVPNYNHESFLKDRLNSIFNQSFQDFEVIILDDASTDNSKTILKQYEDHPKVSHLIFNSENSGSPFKQWVKGIKLAIGEYIWIAESDDYADIYFLEKTVRVLESNPNISLVYSDSFEIDENGEIKSCWRDKRNDFFSTDRWSKSYQNNGIDETFKFLIKSNTINNISSVLFKRNSVLSNEFLETIIIYKNVGDLYLYLYLLINGDIFYLNDSLNYLRIHNTNTTKSNAVKGVLAKERLILFSQLIEIVGKDVLHKYHTEFKKSLKSMLNKTVFKAIKTKKSYEVYSILIKMSNSDILNKKYFISLIYGLKFYVLFRQKEFIKKSIRNIWFK